MLDPFGALLNEKSLPCPAFCLFCVFNSSGVEIYNYFKHQDIYFLDGKPFIQNPDGYFFRRLAKDFERGEDVLRSFPKGGVKYDYPPLISFMYGILSRLTGKMSTFCIHRLGWLMVRT